MNIFVRAYKYKHNFSIFTRIPRLHFLDLFLYAIPPCLCSHIAVSLFWSTIKARHFHMNMYALKNKHSLIGKKSLTITAAVRSCSVTP